MEVKAWPETASQQGTALPPGSSRAAHLAPCLLIAAASTTAATTAAGGPARLKLRPFPLQLLQQERVDRALGSEGRLLQLQTPLLPPHQL